MNGLIRLGQWDAPSIVTSMVEELLPAQLKAKWSDNTITQKKVPPVTELIAFLVKWYSPENQKT